MRTIFVDEVTKIAREDDRVVFLMSECGFSVTERFEEEFPSRFYNTGIAEQSLVGTAAGIALRGLRPIAYNMAMFLTMRAYEQIRVDVCYQNLPVVLAGVGPGLGYGAAGTTHHSIEDVAIMRVLPNLTIVFPSCDLDVRPTVRQAIALGTPCYIGLGRAPRQLTVPYSSDMFQIGKAIRMTEGTDAAIFTYGSMIPVALDTAELLKKEGIALRVYNMHTIKPIDKDAIDEAAVDCGLIFSLEEENIIGGLGGAIAEYIAEKDNIQCRFRRLGVPDMYLDKAGSYSWLLKQFKLDPVSVANTVKEVVMKTTLGGGGAGPPRAGGRGAGGFGGWVS
jgi:transketolase